MSNARSTGRWPAALVAALLASFPARAGAQEEDASATTYPTTLQEEPAPVAPAEPGAAPVLVPPPAPDLTLPTPTLLAAGPAPVAVSPDAPPVGVVGGAAPFERKHATGSFAVGAVETSGFGAGFSGSFAWDLTERWGIELTGGVGGMQERGGGAVGGVYVDVGFLMPVTFNICSSVPRVCPALDFEISIFPGLAYAYLDGNHAGNVILGFGVSSLRKMQYLDVGVRASILGYIDVVGAAVEASASRLLGLVQLQLGCVVRWGVAQP